MSIYEKIINLLEKNRIKYIEKSHKEEGYGLNVAKIHDAVEDYGAKALVLKLKYNNNNCDKKPIFCLAIVPFTKRINLNYVKDYFTAKRISFASSEESESITQCRAAQSHLLHLMMISKS